MTIPTSLSLLPSMWSLSVLLFNDLAKKERSLQLQGIMTEGNNQHLFCTVVFEVSSFVGNPVYIVV